MQNVAGEVMKWTTVRGHLVEVEVLEGEGADDGGRALGSSRGAGREGAER